LLYWDVIQERVSCWDAPWNESKCLQWLNRIPLSPSPGSISFVYHKYFVSFQKNKIKFQGTVTSFPPVYHEEDYTWRETGRQKRKERAKKTPGAKREKGLE